MAGLLFVCVCVCVCVCVYFPSMHVHLLLHLYFLCRRVSPRPPPAPTERERETYRSRSHPTLNISGVVAYTILCLSEGAPAVWTGTPLSVVPFPTTPSHRSFSTHWSIIPGHTSHTCKIDVCIPFGETVWLCGWCATQTCRIYLLVKCNISYQGRAHHRRAKQ